MSLDHATYWPDTLAETSLTWSTGQGAEFGICQEENSHHMWQAQLLVCCMFHPAQVERVWTDVQGPGQGDASGAVAKRARAQGPDSGFGQFRFSGGAAPGSGGSAARTLNGLNARPSPQVLPDPSLHTL